MAVKEDSCSFVASFASASHYRYFLTGGSDWKCTDFGGDLEKDIFTNTFSFSAEWIIVYRFVHGAHCSTCKCCKHFALHRKREASYGQATVICHI